MDDQARALAPILKAHFEAGRIALISAEADWTLEFARSLREEMRKQSRASLVEMTHLPGETDFKTLAVRVKQASPDAVVVNSFGASVTKLIKDLRAIGIDSPIYASSGLVISDGALSLLRESDIPKLQYFTVSDPPPAFVSLYQKKFGSEPHFFAFWAFQDAELFVYLMSLAHNTSNPVQLAKNMKVFRGRFAEMRVSPDGDIVEPVVLRLLGTESKGSEAFASIKTTSVTPKAPSR